MRIFRFICWVPAATWVWARIVVDGYDGWGAWAAAPLLLGTVALSDIFLGVGLLLASRSTHARPGSGDWVAIGVSSLPLLWIAYRVLAS